MATTLGTIDPVTASVEVAGDYPITAQILDPTAVDPALVEIDVNGVSCTVANDRLQYWQTKGLSGPTIIDDYTDVYFSILARYFEFSGESVTATVNYNSAPIGSTTFTSREFEGDGQKGLYWTAWAIPVDSALGAAPIEYVIYEIYFDTSYNTNHLIIDSMAHVGGDARYHVGTRYRAIQHASGVVGIVVINHTHASGAVQGWRLDRQPASGVVQGWKLNRQPASGVVGVRFRYLTMASGVVGEAYLKITHASGVVYGVNRNNVLDVQVVDDATYQALLDEGVTFS